MFGSCIHSGSDVVGVMHVWVRLYLHVQRGVFNFITRIVVIVLTAFDLVKLTGSYLMPYQYTLWCVVTFCCLKTMYVVVPLSLYVNLLSLFSHTLYTMVMIFKGVFNVLIKTVTRCRTRPTTNLLITHFHMNKYMKRYVCIVEVN